MEENFRVLCFLSAIFSPLGVFANAPLRDTFERFSALRAVWVPQCHFSCFSTQVCLATLGALGYQKEVELGEHFFGG